MRVLSRDKIRDLHLSRAPGMAWYVAGIPGHEVEAHCGHGDAAWRTGGAQAEPSLTLLCPDSPGEPMQISPASAWGVVSTSAERCAELLGRLAEAMDSEGQPMTPTAAQAAGRFYRSTCEKTDPGQLAPRWWRMSKAAIHQGPIAQTRGGAGLVAHWDRKQAFLSALRQPMPLRNTWRAVRPALIDEWDCWLDEGEGLVSAIVHCPGIKAGMGIGPLPFRANGRTIWPVGTIWGTWTIEELRRAITAGAQIEHVWEVALCDTAKWLEPLADRIDAIKSPELKKLIYTRFWGSRASEGGYRARGEWFMDEHGEPNEAPQPLNRIGRMRLRGSELPWEWEGCDPTVGKASPYYRPDLAAFIAGDNCARMQRALYSVPGEAVIAAHVDAIWIDLDRVKGEEWKPVAGDDWILKGTGPMRSYRVGTYIHWTENDRIRLAAMGWPEAGEAPKTPEELESWAAPTQYHREFTTVPKVTRNEIDIDGELEIEWVTKTHSITELPRPSGMDGASFDPRLGPSGVPVRWTEDGRQWAGDSTWSDKAWSVPCRIQAPPAGIPETPTIYARRWSPGGWYAKCSCEEETRRKGSTGCQRHSLTEPDEDLIRYAGKEL